MTCMFTGHRSLPSDCTEIENAVYAAILRLIERGFTRFVSGGAVGFDLLCARVVLRLRELHPHIELCMILPCRNQDAKYSPSQRREYNDILSRANQLLWLNEEYFGGCMLERNRAMVNMSTHCIAYLKKPTGGTAYTVNYALRQDIPIEYI